MQSGDLLLVTTDGVIETSDSQGNEFGLERVERILLENITEPLSIIAKRLQDAVRSFGNQIDDQTILLLRVIGDSGKS